MDVRSHELISPKLVKVLAAVVIGLSIGAVLPPNPFAIDAFGLLPGISLAGAGAAIGTVMYTRLPAVLAPKGCGCAGDCGCAD